MTIYISNPDNLKLMMNLLRDKSKNIQFESFHVFKVISFLFFFFSFLNYFIQTFNIYFFQIFVANPNKAKPILDILLKNKEKLIGFLGNFQNERQG